MLSLKVVVRLCSIGFMLLVQHAALSATSLFQTAQSYSSGGLNTFSVAVADVNGDGKPDIIMASQCFIGDPCNYNEGDRGAVAVLLANGDGTFQSPQAYYSGGGTAFSVAVADVNGDGKPDILVVNACVGVNHCGSGVVGVLLGNGDGTFQPAQSYGSGGIQPFAIAVADVNGDGKSDVFVGNSCALGNCAKSVVSLLLGSGDGTFQAARTLDPGAVDPVSIAVQDINGDGKPDLLIANACINPNDCTGELSVLFGNGDGTFQTAQTYATGGYVASSIWVADVNGDGKPDVLVANTDVSPTDFGGGVISVFLANGDGTFRSPQIYGSGGFSTLGVTVADVNGDSRPDLLTINSCRSALYGSNCGAGGVVGVLVGNGDGTFRAPRSIYAGGFQSKALAGADLDGDGRPDVVTASTCAHTGLCPNGNAGVLLNIGRFETATTITSSLNPSIYGQSVILTATVASIGSATPTGQATFRNGNAPIGSALLSGGVATFETTHLPAGTLSITATYNGDAQSGKSTSAPLSQTVKQASTTTTVKSSLNPSSQGQAVTFTAKVTSPTTNVTGTVTFSAGNSTLGTVAVSGGKAAITTSTLPAGNNTITAAYAGTANIVGSAASLIQVIK